MASASDAVLLAFYLADGCAKILVPLLYFLSSGPSSRSPLVDEAAVFLLLVLPTAYIAGVILAYFVGFLRTYLQLASPAPASASPVYLGRFVALFFTLVSTWLLVIAVQLAAFIFIGTGKLLGFSGNVLG